MDKLMEHKCELDERGLCEECETRKRAEEREEKYRILRRLPKDIPVLEDFPSPFEIGRMEEMAMKGEWGQ
jgi:hypothetical protein